MPGSRQKALGIWYSETATEAIPNFAATSPAANRNAGIKGILEVRFRCMNAILVAALRAMAVNSWSKMLLADLKAREIGQTLK